MTQSEKNMQTILDMEVPANTIATWWMGQSGYIFKTPESDIIGVDLYLSDSCKRIYAAMPVDHSRKVEIFIEPNDLQLDYFFSTHSHGDHADPDTLVGLKNKNTQMIGSYTACQVIKDVGISEDRIQYIHVDETISKPNFQATGVFANPTDDSDLNHVGFLFEFKSGIRFYLTCDNAYHPLLASAAKHTPDVMFVPISPQFGSLSFWEAAKFVGDVKPKTAIPNHYDMFPDNCVDPHQFNVSMRIVAPDIKYLELKHFAPWLYKKEETT